MKRQLWHTRMWEMAQVRHVGRGGTASSVTLVPLSSCHHRARRRPCRTGSTDTATSVEGADGASGASTDAETSVMLYINVMPLDTDLATDGDSFEVIADCIDGLTQLDTDGVPIPALAEKIKASEDGRTYTFTLRDAKWSNGEAVTAADFVFAWRCICGSGGPFNYMMGDIAQIKGAAIVASDEADETTLAVEAMDDRTLVVELEAPVPFFGPLMSFDTFHPINEPSTPPSTTAPTAPVRSPSSATAPSSSPTTPPARPASRSPRTPTSCQVRFYLRKRLAGQPLVSKLPPCPLTTRSGIMGTHENASGLPTKAHRSPAHLRRSFTL